MAHSTIVKRLLFCLAVLTALAAYIWWGNTSITVTEFAVSAPTLPEEFSGYRIAQISDLHNAQFGDGNQTLLKKLAQCRPDIIVLTGDLIDSRRTNVSVAADFAARATRIAPTYYVTGNHEARVPADYQQLRSAMLASGVHVLENEFVTLGRGSAEISLVGLHDPKFSSLQDNLDTLASQTEAYTILLAHHPDLLDIYAHADADLVFSGHAHGGQFRLPVLGGLIAPGQGLLPEYDAGLYQKQDTQMIVSRGLGNSLFPFRLNNRPEIVVAELN